MEVEADSPLRKEGIPAPPLFRAKQTEELGAGAGEGPGVKVEQQSRDGTPLRSIPPSTSSSLSLPPAGQHAPRTPTPSSAFSSRNLHPPTPSRLTEIKAEYTTPRKTSKRLSALSSFSTSPFLPDRNRERADRSETPDSRKRKLGEIAYAIPAVPDRGWTAAKAKEIPPDVKTVGLGAVNDAVRLEEIDMDDIEAKRGKEEVEREVGVGISPRKGKVKWNGRGYVSFQLSMLTSDAQEWGALKRVITFVHRMLTDRDIPLSVRLAQLTSTESASLTLFYTSLYHTLNPSSRTPNKRPQNTSHTSTDPPKPDIDPPKVISALSHIRTAPIRLILTRPASGRMHNAHLWRATVIRWPKLAYTPRALTGRRSAEDEESEEAPEELIVNLSIPSNSARRTGVDPRVVEEKWRSEGPSGEGEGWEDESA